MGAMLRCVALRCVFRRGTAGEGEGRERGTGTISRAANAMEGVSRESEGGTMGVSGGGMCVLRVRVRESKVKCTRRG